MNNEPVAWIEPITESVMKDYDYQNNLFANETGDWIPLYTHPVKELIEEKSYEVVFDGEKYTTKLVEPKVKELTDEDLDKLIKDAEQDGYMEMYIVGLIDGFNHARAKVRGQ